jgi:hypothetical protein
MSDAPFLSQPSNWSHWNNIWTSERGENPIAFFTRFQEGAGQNFRPLGDTAQFGTTLSAPLVYALPPGSDALAHPTDFIWILDDAGSGNPDNISYWWPVAPPGYVALGLCFSQGAKPVTVGYWCVHERYCLETDWVSVWSDEGQGWKHHDGSLASAFAPAPAPANMILPNTLLSLEAMGNGTGASYLLSWT